MPDCLLKCNNLSACDEYFNKIVNNGFLGDLEPRQGEIDHLSALIARELKKPLLNLQGSLSIAVFLVWMGWLYYQEGNYWGPVYQNLGLPPEQHKWQSVLGYTFLQAVRKYNLYDFQGKLPYIIPILAHGYVPNWHLESYFEDVILAIYKNREKFELQIKREEIEHLISSWRNDYDGYEKYQSKIAILELVENKLNNICEALKHKDSLLRLQSLHNKLINIIELNELLTFPEDWLDKKELEKVELKERYNSLLNWKEVQQKTETKNTELKLLELDIKEVAEQILQNWDKNLTSPILNLPMREIRELIEKIKVSQRMLVGLRGWLLRLFAPAKYRQFCSYRQRLEEFLNPLPIKQIFLVNPWLRLPQILPKLQDLSKQYSIVVSELAELNDTLREAKANNKGLNAEDLEELQARLDNLTQELKEYKSKLVVLGKGDLEEGKEKLTEQRELRHRIDLLQTQIPGNTDTLLNYLPIIDKYAGAKKLERRLIRIKKKIKEARENLKIFKNPLYTLNESTRVFILQGKEKAIEFIFESLMLIDGFHKSKTERESQIPNRIKKALQHWWEQKGKGLLEMALEEKAREREAEVNSGLIIRKPVIKFDPIHKEVKVILPRQPVEKKADAWFYVLGESEHNQKMILPLVVEKDVYWSEATELVLEHPEPIYHLLFQCENVIRPWQINGIGRDNFCMLFDKHGELVIDNQLPVDGVYIITPVGSSVDLVEDVREQLSGYWSDYEYRYIDLENIDVVVVKTGEDISIYKRLAQLQPMLLSQNALHGITAGHSMIYQEQLPSLLFSINHPEEIQFYGLRIDVPGQETVFKPLNELKGIVGKDNVVYVFLAGLVEKKYGLYKITLEKRGNILWSEQCAVIPDLKLIFDQQAYKVQDNFREIGKLKFCSRHKCEFIPDSMASAVLRTISPNTVEFDTRQNDIQGSLVYHFEQKFTIDVNIQIPGIRWRHLDAIWKAETEEIWHEDLGDIEVKIPVIVKKPIKLSIGGGKQVISSPVRQGIATFNLRRFSDTLFESGKPLQEIILSCAKTEIHPFVMMRVRTRWQVKKVNLTQRLQDDNRNLLLEWEDLGRAINRVVRFWPLNMPDINPIEQAIPDDVHRIDITVPVKLMPPGRYRLHLTIVDPWSNDIASIPEQATENCKDIDIGTKEEQLKTYLGKRLEIVALYHKEQEIKPEINYWLEVTELNPTFEEEIRLMGNVFSYAMDGSIDKMPFNPVSFYISDNKIPFLIDKDGDGVTYCRKCKVMFWEVAHLECRDAVILPDIILVKVRSK
jgi:hypothetical protein